MTDLVNPRQAFFRWTRPDIQPSPARLQLMLSGSGFHELFERLVSTEDYVEQFVERDEIVGRIDIYDSLPTELKTTGSIPTDILASRPGYIDQLAMYCVLAGRSEGRLVVYQRGPAGIPAGLRAFDVSYRDPGAIAAEMIRRRDALRRALEVNEPRDLPRCEWFDLGCDYKGVCACDSASPLSRLTGEGVRILENAGLAASFSSLLTRDLPAQSAFRLNDLIFPRKAAFERKASEDEESVPVLDPAIEVQLVKLERRGFAGALFGALRFGVPGAFSRLTVQLRGLRGWVNTYRGAPTILRTSKFRDMVQRARLGDAFPHYIDRLAIECALAGQERGRLIVYYEQLPGDKFMVYDLEFRDLGTIRQEADRRLALLEAGANPLDLPACPRWMSKFCLYAPRCGCQNEAT